MDCLLVLLTMAAHTPHIQLQPADLYVFHHFPKVTTSDMLKGIRANAAEADLKVSVDYSRH